jgi:hypothetical protein
MIPAIFRFMGAVLPFPIAPDEKARGLPLAAATERAAFFTVYML